MSFFVWCIIIMAVASGLKQMRSNQLKEKDPEKWERIKAVEDRRKRSMAGGALKAARFLLKR